jgi:hypothetical protein
MMELLGTTQAEVLWESVVCSYESPGLTEMFANTLG